MHPSSSNRTPHRARSRRRTTPERQPRSAALPWSLTLLPLLCIALGGGTARWSQGTILVLLGILLLLAPPRLSLGWKFNLVLAGLFGLALTGFLPAKWFALPAWRAAMTDDFGFILPATLSPQPWLSAESSLLFLAGICWFYVMATVDWTPEERLRAGRLFGAGVVALATLFLVLLKWHINVPIWPTERHFGPFPNRNQTANFLAIGALPVLACAHLAWRARRRVAAALWMVGWLAVAVAAFVSFSRAGVALLFGGTAVYLGVQAARGRHRDAGEAGGIRRRLDRWRTAGLAIALGAILLSVFLVFGGETLGRFKPGSAESTAQAVTTEFRLRIQGDALHMIAASPWCGLGLGNFAAVFPLFRATSALPARAIHPESDWLWLTAELGWPALLLVLVGLVLLCREIWPWRRTPDRSLRTAAAVACAAFALHSFVDVSAHRLGTCLCVLFVLGLALRGEAPGTAAFRLPARWPAVLFRLLGIVLLVGGSTWVLEAWQRVLLPGEEGVRQMETEAVLAEGKRDYALVVRQMNQALVWAPLEWSAYYTRGGALVYLGRDEDEAAADFQRARYLEPFVGEVPLDEARIWLATGHAGLAVNALVEACRREPSRAGEYVDRVDSVAPQNALFAQQMEHTALVDPWLVLPFLNELEPPQSGQFISRYLQRDPDLHRLTPEQQTKFFRFWAQRGEAADLAARMVERPDWQRLGWRWWADACAHVGEDEQACGIANRFATPPALPRLAEIEEVPVADLVRQAAAAPEDAALALRLYVAQNLADDHPAALATVRRIAASPHAPAYFHYLEALAAGQTGDWKAGWNAWQEYLEAKAVQE